MTVRSCSVGERMTYHHVDVSGSHWVAIKELEELVCWTVLRKRVCGRAETLETVFSLAVGLELSSEVVVGLVVWILEIVLSVGRGLPDVDCDIWDWLLGGHVGNNTVHVGDQAAWSWVLDDATIEFSPWSVGAPERTEDSGGGRGVIGLGGDVVCDFGHETRSSQQNGRRLRTLIKRGLTIRHRRCQRYAGPRFGSLCWLDQ